MDITCPIIVGLAIMPSLISGPLESSCGTSICAPSCAPLPSGYVVTKNSPVDRLMPCATWYGHSSAYNYGVYPVQKYLYASAPGGR